MEDFAEFAEKTSHGGMISPRPPRRFSAHSAVSLQPRRIRKISLPANTWAGLGSAAAGGREIRGYMVLESVIADVMEQAVEDFAEFAEKTSHGDMDFSASSAAVLSALGGKLATSPDPQD